jgi:hypothetical protein
VVQLGEGYEKAVEVTGFHFEVASAFSSDYRMPLRGEGEGEGEEGSEANCERTLRREKVQVQGCVHARTWT